MEEYIYWAWFAALKGITLFDKHKVINSVGDVRDVYKISDKGLEAIVGKPIAVDRLDRNLKSVASSLSHWSSNFKKRSLISWSEGSYPTLLREIDSPPLCLYIEGNADVLNCPQVAMVGSRKNSFYGKKIALHFAERLGEVGITITSGLALGIDRYAHEGSLNAKAQTVAVLANGIDKVYPSTHQELAHRIIEEGGCLVSEFPLGAPPLRNHFPRRNRIISGLSQAVIVVEAERKSGSLITARLAIEQNREVYAVPGSIFSAQSIGCHDLIANGAKLAVTIEEILEDLYLPLRNKVLEQKKVLVPKVQMGLMKFIGCEPISMDEIILESRLTSGEVSAMLLELELKDVVVRNDMGLFVKK